MDFLGSGITFEGVCLAVFFGHKEVSKSDATVGHMSTNIILGITATGCQGFEFLVMKPAMIAGTDPLAGLAIHLLGRAFLICLIALWPAKIFQPRSKLAPQLLGQMIVSGFIGYGISSALLLYALTHFDVGIHCHRSGVSVFCAGLTNSVGKRRSGATCTGNPRSRFSSGWHHHNYNPLR